MTEEATIDRAKVEPLPEECLCTCHVFEAHGSIKHTIPCCRQCATCGKHIVAGYEDFHRGERHPAKAIA